MDLIQQHNSILFEEYETHGPATLGPYSSYTWRHDPKHVLFTMARYKFAAKLLVGKANAVEIGCGDALGAPLLLQSVNRLHCLDLENAVIEDNLRRIGNSERLRFETLDILAASPEGPFDAAVSLDVIEHIDASQEHLYVANIAKSLSRSAVAIIGTPNVTADRYASQNSRDGHINLKSHTTLAESMSAWFENVFIFSMNDEVVHTGFSPMAHYLMAVCSGVKERA